MDVREISVKLDAAGAAGQKVAISAVSAQSAAITLRPTPTSGDRTEDVLVTPSVDCFVKQGSNPTAVVDTDVLLLGGNTYRLSGFTTGNKLAFITSGAAGNVWIYPGA
jgi:hypothetical protein